MSSSIKEPIKLKQRTVGAKHSFCVGLNPIPYANKCYNVLFGSLSGNILHLSCAKKVMNIYDSHFNCIYILCSAFGLHVSVNIHSLLGFLSSYTCSMNMDSGKKVLSFYFQ